MTILKKVQDAIDHLRTLDTPGLTAWAKVNGMDNRSAFAHFKKALLSEGIDYNALRAQHRMEKQAATRAGVTHDVVLYSDAKAKFNRFGITDDAGNPVWYGRFFDDDRDYDGEQSSGELAAAKKAVWLASKIAQVVGGTVKLTLKVDAEWLCWANEVGNAHMSANDRARGGQARMLGELAEKQGVVLHVEHVAGAENPADPYTVCHGFKKWSDNDLAALAHSHRNEGD